MKSEKDDDDDLMFLKPMITSFIILVFLGAVVGGGMCVCCCRKAFCLKKNLDDTQVVEPRQVGNSSDFLSVNWDSGKKPDNTKSKFEKFQKVDLSSSRVVSQ